ncbi:MAG: Membrane-bound lytic murein transglycosylase precursor [Pseudomonadota bacterium]
MTTQFMRALTQSLALACISLALAGCANLEKPSDAKSAATEVSTENSQPSQTTSVAKPVKAKQKIEVSSDPPADIWVRIRQGFAMPDLENDLVKDREEWYAARPDYMVRMTERSRKYLFHIVEELERRNMPTELALLPFIESAFNPEAVSSAKAAGMWQFMPATGKYFDLKQNMFRDERRGVVESTRAALDYLQKLYGMFGDWHLALAAYNWGEGSVSRALAKNKAAGLGLTYSDLNMPTETRYYVPKLQAVKNIIAQPQSFNARLPLIQNHPYFRSVSITRDIDVKLAANFAGISLDDFKALNPSMSRPVILAAGTPEILLPWDNADKFLRRLEEHANKPLASWTAWSVPKTMKIAEVGKLVNMSESELRSINPIPNGMQVKQGSTLLVARQGNLDSDVTEHLADNAQISFAPEVVLRRIMVTTLKGDTLATLAARHDVTPTNIAAWNKLKIPVALKPGQSIAILVPTTASSKGSKTATKKSSINTGVKSTPNQSNGNGSKAKSKAPVKAKKQTSKDVKASAQGSSKSP